jgi:hypothetical protein
MKDIIFKCLKQIENENKNRMIVPEEVTELELKRSIMDIVHKTVIEMEKEGRIRITGKTINGLKLLKTTTGTHEYDKERYSSFLSVE